MANDPNKEKEQQGESTETTTAQTTTTTPAPYIDPTEILIDEQTIEDINDQYKENVKTIETGYEAREDAVKKAYGSQLSGYGEFLREVGKRQMELNAQDAEAKRKADAYRYIAGVGDAISGVANLVGTAHGAVNQPQAYNAPEIVQKAETARKERKLEIDQLKARLDELKAHRTALEGERELKLGELAGSKASDLATAELKRLQGIGKMKSANTKAKAQLAVQGMKSADKRYTTDNKKTSGASKPGEEYTFYGADGKPTTIPGHKWNKEAALKAYSLIPEERRTKRQKYDKYGDPIEDAYQNPSMTDILYDIAIEAETNPELQQYLTALASGTALGAKDPRWK